MLTSLAATTATTFGLTARVAGVKKSSENANELHQSRTKSDSYRTRLRRLRLHLVHFSNDAGRRQEPSQLTRMDNQSTIRPQRQTQRHLS